MRIYEAGDVINLTSWQLQVVCKSCFSDALQAGNNANHVHNMEQNKFLTHGGDEETPAAPAGATCLSWCPSRFSGPMLAVGCSGSPSVFAKVNTLLLSHSLDLALII